MTAGGLGRVETQRVVLFTADDPLVLESGATLGPVEVAYETYGTLDDRRSNAVFVRHALTGDAHAAGHHGDPARRGWWDRLIGPGRPIDTDRFFVVSPNLLGGCQGTTGPSSINPATGRRHGLEFPMFSVRDLNTVHRRLLDHLGITRLHAALGGSLGGMQALQWAIDDPQAMTLCAPICASAELSAMNIAFSTVAREAIMRDPGFQGGRLPRQPAGAGHRARRRPHDGPHHLSLRGVLRAQVRAHPPRRGRTAGPGSRLRGRALPAPSGRELPGALRRAHATST